MHTLIFLLPILAVIALLATRKAGLLTAGVIALALSVPAAWVALSAAAPTPPDVHALTALVWAGSVRGSWIAWQAVSIILGGLLLYSVLNTARPELFAPRAGVGHVIKHHWLFTICFLLGPFVEAATGFGVGYLITISALMRLGLDGLQAAVLGLFSQMMVPWGALGVGTWIGAELAGLPIRDIGVHGALIYLPLLLGYLGVFWWIAAQLGRRPSVRHCVDDLLWTVALGALLLAANAWVAVEVAGLLCTAPLIVLRWWRDREPGGTGLRELAQIVWPYALLTVLLVATRSIDWLNAALRDALVIRLPADFAEDLPGFAVFHHASFWLLLVAVGYGALQLSGAQWRAVGRAVTVGARIPVLVSIVFLVMAEIMTLAGIPAALAASWVSVADTAAVTATPLMGLVAGALTASNTASNGMLMVLQVELAARVAADPVWIATVQNLAGSNATLISPIRIAMGCAVVALSGHEAQVYRLIWPLGVVLLVVLEAVALLA